MALQLSNSLLGIYHKEIIQDTKKIKDVDHSFVYHNRSKQPNLESNINVSNDSMAVVK